ncbi:MerC domain-containing protein [Sphingobium sp. AP49]|uniref:MerC domain-containing protein n=1 Tax=Sphingobium sp. AP49 TaxID=1144307 RepID=UPI00026ED348|nr:MerC domain-containing protein [Sphingobium sp. AP49]WHO37731.1 MerC domain-containing protein [Sphingobium sp. AP49]
MPPCEATGCDPARPRSWLDGFAICASALCTIHCLGLPLLFALLPAIAARIDPGESFHLLMLAIAVPTSLFALLQGWRRHRGALPVIAGLAGLSLMTVGALVARTPLAETLWTVGGSALLAGAHMRNWCRGLRAAC